MMSPSMRLLLSPLFAPLCWVHTVLAAPTGLVGHWNFDDQTGADQTANQADMTLGGTTFYPLTPENYCLRFEPDREAARIPASPESPLAISRGTVCLWLNMAWEGETILEYDNNALQFRIYRRHFQPRFKGSDSFDYGSGLLDDHWPNYDLREWAFYPHVRSAVGDSQWHHFAVAYDEQAKQIKGWRDGTLIATVDLSEVGTEALRREGLSQIIVGNEFVGFLDDIRIYNRVLPDAELQAIYEASRGDYDDRSDTIPTDRKMDIYAFQSQDKTLYQAWLQTSQGPATKPPAVLGQITSEPSHSTVQTAALELKAAIDSFFSTDTPLSAKPSEGSGLILGTPATSSWIRHRSAALRLDEIRNDGYVIRSLGSPHGTHLVIAAQEPGGVIQGAFELIRRLRRGARFDLIDHLENPHIPLRMVGHWSNFRGFLGDDWRGGRRDHSIFSWEDLRRGDHNLIRDWVRLIASAGWNALCPSEVNWSERNNFLEHLDEVETLARICRQFGVTLYWSPSYLLALDPATAPTIYQRVPDFGGYVLKLGSEKQNGDPRPPMVNRIADHLAPFGGHAVVRAFVYGNLRYTPKPYRNMIPYDLFAANDGVFRDNVILTPKSGPLDWDLSAPLPSLDGALQQTKLGSEWVIDKSWPVSWVEKWKWWLDQDTYRQGPGTFNKDQIHCVMGVAMISPSPSWTASPLNMVNYYGLGRLAWNPDLSLEEVYRSWIRQTFGDHPEVLATLHSILRLSDDALRKQYLYRGYRGVWIDRGDDGMVESKTPHVITPQGIGIASDPLQSRLLNQYAHGLQAIYSNPIRSEEFLTSFHHRPLDYQLTIGRTLIQDVYGNLEEAIGLSELMRSLWSPLKGKVDPTQFEAMKEALDQFAAACRRDGGRMRDAFHANTGRDPVIVTNALSPDPLMEAGTFNVKHFGALGDGLTDDTKAIQNTIEACAQAGGGTVFLPSGLYRSDPLQLRSDLTLALDIGAVLVGSNLRGDQALLRGNRLQRITLTGPGAIEGSGNGVGIELTHSSEITIRSLGISRFDTGMRLASNSITVLDHIKITDSQDGIHFDNGGNTAIRFSQISAVRWKHGKPVGGKNPIRFESAPSARITLDHSVLISPNPAPVFPEDVVLQSTNWQQP